MRGRVFFKRQVSPELMIVREILAENSPQVSFTEHDDVVGTLSPNGSDGALAVRVLPGRMGRNRLLRNSHAVYSANEVISVGTVVVANQILRLSLVAGECFDQLASRPPSRGLCRDVEMHDLPTFVSHDDEAIQQPESDGGNHEEVAGRRTAQMVAQKHHPRLA